MGEGRSCVGRLSFVLGLMNDNYEWLTLYSVFPRACTASGTTGQQITAASLTLEMPNAQATERARLARSPTLIRIRAAGRNSSQPRSGCTERCYRRSSSHCESQPTNDSIHDSLSLHWKHCPTRYCRDQFLPPSSPSACLAFRRVDATSRCLDKHFQWTDPTHPQLRDKNVFLNGILLTARRAMT